jgi:hypothetical protein
VRKSLTFNVDLGLVAVAVAVIVATRRRRKLPTGYAAGYYDGATARPMELPTRPELRVVS